MSKFLTGKDLEGKLTDIIWDAKKYIVLISPFIRLDNHVKSIFEKIKASHKTHIIIIFGKNERYKQKSFNKEDFKYFKEFKNITILYNKDLHAKYYCNDKEGLITSLNLLDYSMRNNIEYGIHFKKNIINPSDNLFDDTRNYTDSLISKKSNVVFLKKPIFKNTILGLSKSYQNSSILYDISDDFFNGNEYKIKHLEEFDFDKLTDIDKTFDKKPQREILINNNSDSNSTIKKQGYCLRTGEQIPFNLEKPFSYKAFKSWSRYKDLDYKEKYCHKTGLKSNGKTSMRYPVLK